MGDNYARRDVSRKIKARGGTLGTIIHPTAVISPSAEVGEGVFISTFARMLANSKVGDFALIEGYASIGADSVIEE